jgi:uncharacterized protein YjgD (DUF1641 family)
MSEKAIQEQINEINRKLDLLLEEAAVQRQSREAVNDLIDDVAVIGKDAFKTMVSELDNAGVELDGDALRNLLIRLIRSVENMGMVLETIESLNDLMNDLTPIIKQVGLDSIRKFHDLEQKGYFDILSQLGETSDRIISKYSREDIMKLSDNLIPVADTLFILADKNFLEKLNAISTALRDIRTDEIEEYSVWRIMRELNKPQVKKSLGFIMAFLTRINDQNTKIN